MSDVIKPEDVTPNVRMLIVNAINNSGRDFKSEVAAILNAAIDAGLVSPPCHYVAYPSGMHVMHEPGETIQVYPGKCTEPHHRHWKGQTR